MAVAIQREVVTSAPVELTWHYFAQAAEWPTWQRTLVRVDVTPPGELGPWSVATLYPKRGPALTFRVTTFDPCREWTWVTRVLWFDVRWRHTFEPRAEGGTRLAVEVEVLGPLDGLGARVAASLTRRGLNRALPRLARELDAAGAAVLGAPA